MFFVESHERTLDSDGCFIISINQPPCFGSAHDFQPSPRDRHSRHILLRALDYGATFATDHIERIADATPNIDLQDAYLDLILGSRTARYLTMLQLSPDWLKLFLRYPGSTFDDLITIPNDHYRPYTLRVKLSAPTRFPLQQCLFGHLLRHYETYDLSLSMPDSDHFVPIPTATINLRKRKENVRATFRHTAAGDVRVDIVKFATAH